MELPLSALAAPPAQLSLLWPKWVRAEFQIFGRSKERAD
jgi:hypothetical protein